MHHAQAQTHSLVFSNVRKVRKEKKSRARAWHAGLDCSSYIDNMTVWPGKNACSRVKPQDR